MSGNKPIILVDMDGPLANFEKRFYSVCADASILLHGGETNYANPCKEHRFLTDCINASALRSKARSYVEQQGWFAGLEPTEGSIEGMGQLTEVADVWICTKPLEANLTCRDEKAAWVREHYGKDMEKRLIIAPNKGMVNGDLLVDDAIKLEWMPYATWKPVVFPTAWNGAGTDWEAFPRWGWNDSIEELLSYV